MKLFKRTEVLADGTFHANNSLVTLAQFVAEEDECTEPGRYRFFIVRLPFIRWRRSYETLRYFKLTTERGWCYPTWMWSQRPTGQWHFHGLEWAVPT